MDVTATDVRRVVPLGRRRRRFVGRRVPRLVQRLVAVLLAAVRRWLVTEAAVVVRLAVAVVVVRLPVAAVARRIVFFQVHEHGGQVYLAVAVVGVAAVEIPL